MNLHLFIGAAVVVAVSCDVACYNDKWLQCYEKELESLDDFNFCHFTPKMVKCSKASAIACKQNFLDKIENFEAVLTKVCEEGSSLNKEMQTHKDCLKKVLTTVDCAGGIGDFRIITTPHQILDFQKAICRNLHLIGRCVLETAKIMCGDDVENFLEVLYKPSLEMHEATCKEIILPGTIDRNDGKRHADARLPIYFGPLDFLF